MTEIWAKWEGRVVNGIFPLRRFLGTSNHSVVFLTEHKAKGFADAAIKIVPADAAPSEARLSQWRSTADLSHPHLLRLFDAGRCQLGGHGFLFVVMEYAEQTLAEVLPRRALTLEEVREMLLPALDALTYLHSKNLVQSQLKPQNFLVVDDQLKLASDTIRTAGAVGRIAKLSVYDPPEARSGVASAAGDVWGLGVTLIEALTQVRPEWSDERCKSVALPPHLPYEDVIERCLSLNPAHRPSLTDLAAQITQPPPASLVSIAVPAAPEAAEQTLPPRLPAKRNVLVSATAAALTMAATIWAGVNFFASRRHAEQTVPIVSQTASQHAPGTETVAPNPVTPARAPAAAAAPETASAAPPVVHEEIPEVSRRVRAAIRGHIKVTVRVTVDRSGNVVAETVDVSGPSKYFARLAAEAAVKWKFAPADNQAPRKWLLRFDFSRGGTSAHAAGPRA